MNELELLDIISKENSWEEIIEFIVAEEGMDPWDIDIIKLSNSFSSYLSKASSLDFNVPARLIIISAVLIRMKVEIMLWEEQEKKEQEDKEEFQIDMSKIPELQVPLKRMPTRKVTLNELVNALDKAFRTQNIREKREYRAREKVEEALPEEEFDVSAKIDELHGRITNIIDKMKDGEMKFSDLVTEWTRKDVVESLLPMLHLNNEGKITLKQDEPFKEIFIKMSEENGKESDNGSGDVHIEPTVETERTE